MTGKIIHRKTLNAAGEFEDTPVYFVDNREVSAAEYHAAFPDVEEIGLFGAGSGHSGWPMRSEAVACHPKDREKAMDAAARAGIPTYFDRLGRPEFTSIRHQRAYLKFRGYHNNDDNS